MRIVVILSLCAVAITGIFAEKVFANIIQTETYNGHTYYLLDDDTWWNGFEAEAVALGGHLVTIDNEAENDFICNTFGPTAQSSRSCKISLFIGLNDAVVEGNFMWSSGAMVAYTHWAAGQPQGDAADEDYVGMVINVGGMPTGYWHDIFSDKRGEDVVFGVVEIIPEPATIFLFGIGVLSLFRRKK